MVRDPEVSGFLVQGSVAHGDAYPTSDLDLSQQQNLFRLWIQDGQNAIVRAGVDVPRVWYAS